MRFFKINNLPTKVKKKSHFLLLEETWTLSPYLLSHYHLSLLPCQCNKGKVSKISWCPHGEMLSSVSNWATCWSEMLWTWHPRAGMPLAQLPNKCSHPERDTDVFIGLCNQLVKLEERKSEEKRRKSTPLVKRIQLYLICLFTNKDVRGLSVPWVLHIDNIREKGKEKRLGFFFCLLCLTECHQRTITWTWKDEVVVDMAQGDFTLQIINLSAAMNMPTCA